MHTRKFVNTPSFQQPSDVQICVVRKPRFLKLISSPYSAHSREFYDFCLDSCKTSQNVTFRIYLHQLNSKFLVNRHYRCEELYALFFLIYHLMKTFTAVTINEADGKRIWKVSKIRYVYIDSHSINSRVLRLHSTDWKSSLSYDN